MRFYHRSPLILPPTLRTWPEVHRASPTTWHIIRAVHSSFESTHTAFTAAKKHTELPNNTTVSTTIWQQALARQYNNATRSTQKHFFPCPLWTSLTLRDERKLRVFENMVFSFFLIQCHHMSFVDFVVLPPGHGRRLGRPWGAVTLSRWCVSGDTGGCSARRGLKPKVY